MHTVDDGRFDKLTSLEDHDTAGASTIGTIVEVQETVTGEKHSSINDFGKRLCDQDCIPQDSKRVRFDLSPEAEQSSGRLRPDKKERIAELDSRIDLLAADKVLKSKTGDNNNQPIDAYKLREEEFVEREAVESRRKGKQKNQQAYDSEADFEAELAAYTTVQECEAALRRLFKIDKEVVEDLWKRSRAYKFYFQNAFDFWSGRDSLTEAQEQQKQHEFCALTTRNAKIVEEQQDQKHMYKTRLAKTQDREQEIRAEENVAEESAAQDDASL